MSRALFASLVCVLALACGGRTPAPTGPPPLCQSASKLVGDVRHPRALEWLALLAGSVREGGVTDCSGTEVAWDRPPSCAAADESGRLLGPHAAGANDVRVFDVSPTHRLTWIATRRYTTGDALGLLGLVETVDDSLVVRALGSLRAFAAGLELRLTTLPGQRLVLAKYDDCKGDDETACERSLRIVRLDGNRFEPVMLHDPAGTCLGPEPIALSRQRTVPLSTGGTRHFALVTTVELAPSRILIHEIVRVEDFAADGDTPPRPYRQAEATREIHVKRGRFVISEPTLWQSILEAEGVSASADERKGGR